MKRFHIKAWGSLAEKAQWPTVPHEQFSVYRDGEREARQLVADMVRAGYPKPVVVLYGPHGFETFSS